ncbi:MAG: hypothetical protein GX075_13470 [Firmicutes bacterium]|nr:hypothetical protein [Bacillota bacterium]
MTTISQIADLMGEYLCRRAGLENDLKRICFGIEVIMVMLLTIIVPLMIGGVFNIFHETLIITLTAFIMKNIIGSPHLSGFFRCLVYSAVLILSGAWLVKFYTLWLIPAVALTILLIDFSIILTVKLAPSYRNFDRRQTTTRKFGAIVLVLGALIGYLEYFNLSFAGALIGFSISIINISPWSVNFVKWLDQITKGGVSQ